MVGGATPHRITTQGSTRKPRPDKPRLSPARAQSTEQAGWGADATAPGSHKTDRTKPHTSRKGRGPRPPLPLWLLLIGLIGMQWKPVQATATVPTDSVVGSKRAIRLEEPSFTVAPGTKASGLRPDTWVTSILHVPSGPKLGAKGVAPEVAPKSPPDFASSR